MREKINYVRAAKEFAYLITYTRLLGQQSDNLLIRGSVTGPGRIEEDEGDGGGGGGSSSNNKTIGKSQTIEFAYSAVECKFKVFYSSCLSHYYH